MLNVTLEKGSPVGAHVTAQDDDSQHAAAMNDILSQHEGNVTGKERDCDIHQVIVVRVIEPD